MNKEFSREKLGVCSVAAVVVTFNRKELLLECIRALIKQSTMLDRIYVIDNCSTDGTEKEISLSYKNHKQLEYIRLDSNTGGSGGFYHGISKAYADGYEWIWMMDDDVEPLEHALETLLKFKNLSQCIHPGRMYADGSQVDWSYIFDPVSLMDVAVTKDIQFEGDLVFTNVGCFEGMLINRNIVAKIGFPDRNFFLTKDDLLYGFEASAYTNVCVTRELILIKKIKPQIPAKITSIMHSVKNTLLIADKLDRLRPAEKKKRAVFKYIVLANYLYSIVRFYKLQGLVAFFKAIGMYNKVK